MNHIFIIMDFGNLSEIANVNLSEITHVSETPPSSPGLSLYTNSSGSTFEFPGTEYSDYRDSKVEIKSLRNELGEKDRLLKQAEQSLADLRQEVASLKAKKVVKTVKKKPDRALQKEVRRNYKFLGETEHEAYDFDLRFDCLFNRKMTERVIRAVRGTLGSSYTDEQITSCCQTYFTSLRGDRRRKQNGTLDVHRKRSGRTIRLSRKLERRREIIESKKNPPPLTAEQMAQAKDMVNADITYMSSDESDTEDGDGYSRVRKVRRLAWESMEMSDIKDIIDTHGFKCANKKQKAKMVLLKRDTSCDISARKVPGNLLNWAVNVFYVDNQ